MSDDDPGWPLDLRGVTESVVTTLGPNGRWNCAALGLLAASDAVDRRDPTDPDTDGSAETDAETAVTARTWGQTRTWRNFRERDEGYVQFVTDPLVFTESALSIHEVDAPVLDAAHAWVRVDVRAIETGKADGTPWVEWILHPREHRVIHRRVPTINRGHGAVIEATVAASRLDVDAYDTDRLLDRLSYLERVVERCGGPREHEAFSRLTGIVGRRW